MKFRELLVLLDKFECVEVIYHSFSNGAYSVEELLENNNELLEKRIRPGIIETRTEIADNAIATDSKVRKDESFKTVQNEDIIKIIVELQD